MLSYTGYVIGDRSTFNIGVKQPIIYTSSVSLALARALELIGFYHCATR